MARGGVTRAAFLLDQRIAEALDLIHDPCSIAAGRPTGLNAMGLVLGWSIEGRTLRVTFAVTFAGCTMAPHFTGAARDALLAFPEFDAVETRVDTDHVWTPPASLTNKRMTGTPQAWRQRERRVESKIA